MNGFQKCVRCGSWTVECLPTHSHCWECNYCPEDDEGLRQWRTLEFRRPRSSNRNFKNDREFERLMGLKDVL